MKATLAALAGLLALGGCAIVQDAYDEAATDQCENIIDARQRLDCIDAAETAASDRRVERRDSWRRSDGTEIFDSDAYDAPSRRD